MKDNFNKSSIIKFGVKMSAFFLLIFLLDFTIGLVLKKYYFEQTSGFDFATINAIEKTEAKILILGSSRAENIFNPVIFEQRLNVSCYNAGRDGQPLFYHYAILKANLKRHIPKIVILSFDARNFSKNQDSYDRLSIILPFYKNHPEIRPIIELKTSYEKIKMISAVYPYNSLLLPIISGNLGIGKRGRVYTNGYFPLVGTLTRPSKNIDYTLEKELDTVKINTYREIINECKNFNIELYIVCTPYKINSKGVDHSILVAKKIANENRVKFFDYSSDTFYTRKPYLFADYRHLNEAGVQLISNDVIDKINDEQNSSGN
jgi:hypothetical protein